MKFTFKLFVAFFAAINATLIACDQDTSSSSSSSLIDFQCPEKFGYFPDPYDCSKYFVCVFGDPLHEACTGGLFFSADHQTCDWPRNTPCQQGSSGPNIALSSVNADSISNHRAASTLSDNSKDEILNSPATFSSADSHLIDDPSFRHVTSSPSRDERDNFHHSLNNNLRHSILTQSSSGPKYESSTSSSSSSSSSLQSPSTTVQVTSSSSSSANSNTFFSKDIRDADDQLIHNSNSNGNHDTNSQSNSPITDQSESVTGAQSTGSNSPNFHHVHRLNKDNGERTNLTKYSRSSDSFGRNLVTPSPPSLLIPTTSKTPIIFVSVGNDDDDSLHYSNLNERKIHIHNLTPRRRPPKRIEVPLSSTLLTSVTSNSYTNSNSNSNKVKLSVPVPVAINNQRNAISRQSLLSSSSPSVSSTSLPSSSSSNQQFPFSFFANSDQSNQTNELSIKLLPVLRSANSPGRSIVNLNSPQLSVTTSAPSPFATSTVEATTSATIKADSRVHSLSNLFPEDGQPFGLLDYELSDSNDEAPNLSPHLNSDSIVIDTLSSTGSIKPLINPASAPFASLSSTPSVSPDKPIKTRLPDELPSDVSRASSSSASPSLNVHSVEVKCNSSNCRLPNCNCGSTKVPNNLKAREIPQIVLLTFDDAVNDLNWEIYEQIFNSQRTNPNGCPILGTFYVSHEWTDYSQVQTLYSRGHEIASHGITHSFGEKFSKNQWLREMDGQRQILNRYAGVRVEDVRGMRAPFLQIGGNKQFEMLHEANFTYDSSMPIFENDPPLFPYTLDYPGAHECMITPCPTKAFAGLWEVGLVMYQDLNGGRCSMADACANPSDDDGVFKMLLKNFNRHYKSNRAPFGLFYHSAWFNTQHHLKGFLKFIDFILTKSDVYFTTNWQMIQWMKWPTSLDNINSLSSWNCDKRKRPIAECLNPHVCNVKHKEGSRFMKTCQTCPVNYPWLGRLA